MAQRSKRARRLSALKGAATKRARAEQRQREHGQQARERSEARLTPAQKRARTIAANKLEREIRFARHSERSKRGWETRRRANPEKWGRPETKSRRAARPSGDRGDMGGGSGHPSGAVGGSRGALYSLDQLDDYPDLDDGDFYEIETSPDYGD